MPNLFILAAVPLLLPETAGPLHVSVVICYGPLLRAQSRKCGRFPVNYCRPRNASSTRMKELAPTAVQGTKISKVYTPGTSSMSVTVMF